MSVMKAKEGQAFDPSDMINTSVANVICALLFKEGFDHNDKDFNKLMFTLNFLMDAVAKGAELDHVPLLTYLPSYKRAMAEIWRHADFMVEYIQGQIRSRRERGPQEEPQDFIESYLKEVEAAKQNKSKITQDWIQDIAFDFFAAGAETTSTTLKWALLYMVINPEVQSKVQKELDSVLGDPVGQGTSKMSDRNQLTYTEATIMEVQRRAAIAATALVHCTTSDVEFRGWYLPKDTQVSLQSR